MLVVNIVAHITAAELLAYLLGKNATTPYSALAYGIWAGNIYAVRLDVNEPLCVDTRCSRSISAGRAFHPESYSRWQLRPS
jgi:hypothetical protein